MFNTPFALRDFVGITDIESLGIYVKPQWRNSKAGDVATILCGRQILRKKIMKVHRGTLARIFKNVDYKRIFPESSTVLEAMKATRQLHPDAEEFMSFELKE